MVMMKDLILVNDDLYMCASVTVIVKANTSKGIVQSIGVDYVKPCLCAA